MKRVANILLLLTSMVYAETSAELSPELDEFMTLQPIPEKYFEHNAYIGWMALTYPQDDWLSVYQGIFKANDQILNQRVNNGRLLTNYFANPRQAIFQLSNDTGLLKELFGIDRSLLALHDELNAQELLSFRQDVLDDKRYRYTQDFFVCSDYLNSNCLSIMKERRAYIQETIRNNQVLLNRFKELVETSHYNYALFYNDFNASLDAVPNLGLVKLLQLYLTDAMMNIADGKIDQGLDQLVIVRQWIDLMFNEESKPSLLHFFMNISVTQFLDQAVNVLLDEKLLNKTLDDERLAFIVRPYPDNIGQKLNEVILFEMKQNFKDFAYPYIKIYQPEQFDAVITEEDEYIILSYLKNFGVILSPALDELYAVRTMDAKKMQWQKVQDLRAFTDSSDKMWFNVIHEAQDLRPYTSNDEEELNTLRHSHEHFLELLHEWYDNYFQTLSITPKQAMYYLNEKYSSIHFYNDYYRMLEILSIKDHLKLHLSSKKLEELLKDKIEPATLEFAKSLVDYNNFDNYWLRLYEQQNYHQLVYLKYRWMKDKIPLRNVAEFLKNMGPLALNTVTKQPYVFDTVHRTLSTPLPRQNKYLPSHIKILRLYDSSIRDFKVTLPIQ